MTMRKEVELAEENTKENDNVLDVGCGDGSLYNILICKRYVGVDLEKPYQPFQFFKINIDNEKLPFKENEFDVVLCLEVLEHIQNPQFVINELKRVGKKVVLTTPNRIWQQLNRQKSELVIKHYNMKEIKRFFGKEGQLVEKRFYGRKKIPIPSKIGVVWEK